MHVDGTNNPKIPVGEKHSTKTFSPKIQLNPPKTWTGAVPFFSSSKGTSQRILTVKQDWQKAFSSFPTGNH